MKKSLTIATVLIIVFSMLTSCSVLKSDTPIKDKYDLSKVSFKLNISDAYMTTDYGIYNGAKNEIGIVVHGNVESGKIQEDSQMIFVDENGKVLYNDKVFKIEIIEINTGTEQKRRRQSYAENGNNVALYLNGWNGGDTELYSKYGKNLELIRESQFVISE